MIIEYSIIELNVRSRFRLSHIRFSKYCTNLFTSYADMKHVAMHAGLDQKEQ